MSENRRGSHTITRLTVHIVWVTKYRDHVLKGEIQKRCRELIIQICDAEDIRIWQGAVSKDHVHMVIEYPPSKSIGDIVKRLIGTHLKNFAAGAPRATEALERGDTFGHKYGVPYRLRQRRTCGHRRYCLQALTPTPYSLVNVVT